MPTENRSSNTEMVSDSEMTECQFHNNCGGWCETRRELEHNLCEHCLEAHDEEMASPAQQHKVEPVAWIYSRPEGQVEPVVLLNRASEGDRGSWDETPLYTHADPGDVDQLSQVIRDLNDERDEIGAEVGRLRAKLAERDALLGPIAGWTAETRAAVLEAFQDELNESASYPWYDAAIADLMKLIEALPSSAEPSASNDCAICRDLGDQCVECEEGEFREWADRHFAAADYRKTDAGVFIRDWMRHAYAAWCARAALARKPS